MGFSLGVRVFSNGCFDLVLKEENNVVELQLTRNAGGHILTNANVWSPDSEWIIYDVRSDAEGALFDGEAIEMVNAHGEVRRLYTAQNGAKCGVATFHPHHQSVAFIVGPQHPTPDWEYGPSHRQGVMVDVDFPERALNLDARDLEFPFTPGALRGGSHVHVWSGDGEWLSFTYNDALLERFAEESEHNDIDLRNVGVGAPLGKVRVKGENPRNHNGALFCVLVTRTKAHPTPGSDEICRAFEESWIGVNGFVRKDGTRQKRALAFQGEVVTTSGETMREVFIAEIPDDVSRPNADGPLEGTIAKRPFPPLGTVQRRLTRTQNRRFPGICGPRHWLKSSPDGAQIAFLMRDDAGRVQLWSVSPNGSEPRQITRDDLSVASAFSWNSSGKLLAYVADNSVFVVVFSTGQSVRLTPRSRDENAPLPLACVFSPDGKRIAFSRCVSLFDAPDAPRFNQIFTVTVPESLQGELLEVDNSTVGSSCGHHCAKC